MPEGDAAETGNEARVEEQSHKSEMRDALRGDFERLRARRQCGGEAAIDRSGSNAQATVPQASALEPARRSWRDRLRGLR